MHLIQLQLAELDKSFDHCIHFWHSDPDNYRPDSLDLNATALELARRNYLLWHEEDKARRTDVSDSLIAQVKRNIDGFNQQRNDLIEKLDEEILIWLGGPLPVASDLPTNSETPGSIVDRVSIMSLKIYHMSEDAERTDISDEHRARSLQKVTVLCEQRSDLQLALGRLLDDFTAGRKQMKIYRQFKMYNDPTLNPEVYRQRKG